MRVVAFGEALWDLLPSGPVLGGAPLNFAYRIGSLGHHAVLASAVGVDELGERALARMKALGMETAAVQRVAAAPTGTVDVAIDGDGNPDFTINAPAAYDHIGTGPALESLVRGADCLCFGTLAQRASGSRRTLAALLSVFAGRYALCDVNLRRDCYTPAIVEESLARATVAKLNHDELAELARMLTLPGRSIPERADSLIARAGLSHCLVTLGRRGAYAASKSGERVYSPAYRVRQADTAGAGDAFTAGFLHGLDLAGSLRRACRFGNAMGALVATQSGATQALAAGALEAQLASEDYGEIDPALEPYL